MLRHNISCWWRMAMAQARSEMQYRASFVASTVSLVLTYGGQFLSIYWLTRRFPDINGWRLEELILLYAMAILAWGICTSFFWNLHAFEDQVRNGTFDRSLLRPMNPLMHVLGSQSPVNGLGQFIFSILAFVFAFRGAGVALTVPKLVYLLFTAVGGALIFGAALVTVAALGFFTTRTHTFYWGLVMPARHLVNYPVSIYHKALQAVLTVAVPFAFVNFLPAHVLLDRAGELRFPALAWATPPVGVLALTAAYWFWTLGTRSYTGTGS